MRASPALVALVVLGLASACGSTAARHGVNPGAVVFTSSLTHGSAVYAVNPDGSGLRRLFAVPGQGGQALWNDKGTRVLVIPGYGSHVRPYLLSWPSGNKVVLREKGLDISPGPDWSPDGKKILLTDRDGLVVYDITTHRATRIDVSQDDDLEWSPDSKSVLDMTGYDDTISAAPINGRPRRVIAYVQHSDAGFPGASADGKWFSFIGPYGADLYVLRRSGGPSLRVAHDGFAGVVGTWSPRGDLLAYATGKGVGVLNVANRHRVFVKDATADPLNQEPTWSPDGKWVLYWRPDLGFGAPLYDHLRLWAMRPNGTGAHAVTHLTPSNGIDTVTWVSAAVRGQPVPRPALVPPPRERTITTSLPVVALGARGDGATVATGFGFEGGETSKPLGPIITVHGDGTTTPLRVHGCKAVDSVFVMESGTIGYVCDNNSVGYGFDYAVRLGSATLMHTLGGEFSGKYLSGVATDGRTVAFGVEQTRAPSRVGERFQIESTRIYESRGSGAKLVEMVHGPAAVEAVDGNRIAVIRGGRSVDIVTPAGRNASFKFTGRIDGVAFDGQRLVLVGGGRVTLFDPSSGRRVKSWPVAEALAADLGSGSSPGLAGAQGSLVAYVADAQVHVLDLSNGREVVVSTPGATGPVHAAFGSGGLFFSYNQAYAKRPGRVGFVSTRALEQAISARGRQAR